MLIQVGEAQSADSDGGIDGQHLEDGVRGRQVEQIVIRTMAGQDRL